MMKILIIAAVSLLVAILASAEHFPSLLLGSFTAITAVVGCYGLAFSRARFPEQALLLLFCGLLFKFAITIIGAVWGMAMGWMTSPAVFALSYLIFSITATSLGFYLRSRQRADTSAMTKL